MRDNRSMNKSEEGIFRVAFRSAPAAARCLARLQSPGRTNVPGPGTRSKQSGEMPLVPWLVQAGDDLDRLPINLHFIEVRFSRSFV